MALGEGASAGGGSGGFYSDVGSAGSNLRCLRFLLPRIFCTLSSLVFIYRHQRFRFYSIKFLNPIINLSSFSSSSPRLTSILSSFCLLIPFFNLTNPQTPTQHKPPTHKSHTHKPSLPPSQRTIPSLSKILNLTILLFLFTISQISLFTISQTLIIFKLFNLSSIFNLSLKNFSSFIFHLVVLILILNHSRNSRNSQNPQLTLLIIIFSFSINHIIFFVLILFFNLKTPQTPTHYKNPPTQKKST